MNTNRYNRQIILPDFGKSGQEKLANASVIVIGAGGLGCPVLQILAASGVGKIGIVDFDVVDFHNLHRQFLFTENDIGKPKVEVAKKHLQQLNSEIEIEIFNEKMTNQNGIERIENYDVVVDCTDNFTTRYIINDVCFLLKKPLVYGSLFRYEGQVSVFNVEQDGMTTNYRDLFPIPPNPDEVPNCNEAGVLPTISAMIGTIQANEVIKLLIGSKDVLVHQLLVLNTQNYQTHTITYREKKDKIFPKTKAELQATDYEEFCGYHSEMEIKNMTELQSFLNREKAVLIDVRETHEQPKLQALNALEIPLIELEKALEKIHNFDNICFICASGIRSKKALEITKSYFPEKELKHFSPGVKSIPLDYD